MSDTNLVAGNVIQGVSIFGVAGTADLGTFTGSNAFRDVGSTEVTLQSEVTTYAGSGGTPNLPAGYRAVTGRSEGR